MNIVCNAYRGTIQVPCHRWVTCSINKEYDIYLITTLPKNMLQGIRVIASLVNMNVIEGIQGLQTGISANVGRDCIGSIPSISMSFFEKSFGESVQG